MKQGSLIIFEQSASGYEIFGKQRKLFPGTVIIEPGTSGIICKVDYFRDGNAIIAEILIGDSIICDVDLSKIEFSTFSLDALAS